MKYSLTFILLPTLIGFSCQKQLEPVYQLETLRQANISMQKMVDLKLDEAIWTDEQQGRNNETVVDLLKQLADSRKQLDVESASSMEAHISTLRSLGEELDESPEVDGSLNRLDQYVYEALDTQTQLIFLAELSYLEFVIVGGLSSQMGIVDCCFSIPIQVQTNGDALAGEPYEIAIIPGSDRALWKQMNYSYDNIILSQAGMQIPVEIVTNRIGHVMILQFELDKSGEYMIQFSVTQDGEYLAEPWQQDFEWPVIVR